MLTRSEFIKAVLWIGLLVFALLFAAWSMQSCATMPENAVVVDGKIVTPTAYGADQSEVSRIVGQPTVYTNYVYGFVCFYTSTWGQCFKIDQ
jgi:hypothetical protein